MIAFSKATVVPSLNLKDNPVLVPRLLSNREPYHTGENRLGFKVFNDTSYSLILHYYNIIKKSLITTVHPTTIPLSSNLAKPHCLITKFLEYSCLLSYIDIMMSLYFLHNRNPKIKKKYGCLFCYSCTQK